ncbi:MAG: hypothetical protein ACI8XO_002217 [Verrucomicrobiales bacterium]|jgi:hypothetical protein
MTDDERAKNDVSFTGLHGEYRYQLVRLPLNWGQARRFAADTDGRLAGGDDVGLLRWLAKIDGGHPVSMWLGARRTEDGWLWEDGQSPKDVPLPEVESLHQRLLLTGDDDLAAVDSEERHAFVIEWVDEKQDEVESAVAEAR